jgi:hypothetical protein
MELLVGFGETLRARICRRSAAPMGKHATRKPAQGWVLVSPFNGSQLMGFTQATDKGSVVTQLRLNLSLEWTDPDGTARRERHQDVEVDIVDGRFLFQDRVWRAVYMLHEATPRGLDDDADWVVCYPAETPPEADRHAT